VSEPAVRTERRGRVLVITLNRPAARNAVDGRMAVSLEAAIEAMESDDGIWAGVLTGAGPAFCAGADLKEVAAGRSSDLHTARGGFAGFVRALRRKPVVAAVHGPALGGGLEIAIACDLIVAAEGATLGLPEVSRSVLPAAGGLARLPRLIGEKAALELAMSGVPWPAERLAGLGLISAVVAPESALDEAVRLAEQICRNAPLAVQAARRVILAGRDLPESDRWQLARRELEALYATPDFREGPRAFLEKRAPRWSGRPS
jgi:enoyl-CoA hydratase